MDDYTGYAGRLLAERYRLPQPPADEYELVESLAYDTASGQEVLVRQVPLPEVVEAEFEDGPGAAGPRRRAQARGATRRPADPVVRRAVEAALAASRIPDHPRLDQVFDVFVEGDGLWIVSESVPARPLAALLADRPLGAHRAAEIAADLLAALRNVHAHGWAHRNITARTVLVCEDGRALLTGLAEGAAQEALCGYDPLPAPEAASPEGSLPEARSPEPAQEPAHATDFATDRATGARVALAAAREEETAPGVPATFAGNPLPKGFLPQKEGTPSPYRGGEQDGALFGFDQEAGDTRDGIAGPGLAAGAAWSRGGWAPGGDAGDGAEPGPVAPGYRTSGPVGVPRGDGAGEPGGGLAWPSSANPASSRGGRAPGEGADDGPGPVAPGFRTSGPVGAPRGGRPGDARGGAVRPGSASEGADVVPGDGDGGAPGEGVRGLLPSGPGSAAPGSGGAPRGAGAGPGPASGMLNAAGGPGDRGSPGEGAGGSDSASASREDAGQTSDAEVSARAAKRGAIAAYRAGARRAVAESRGGSEAGERRAEQGEWWTRSRESAPDELPSGADEVPGGVAPADSEADLSRDELREGVYGPLAPGAQPPPGPRDPGPEDPVGPTALPGSRPSEGRWVRAEWAGTRTGRASAAADGAAEGYGPEGEPYGHVPQSGVGAVYGGRGGSGAEPGAGGELEPVGGVNGEGEAGPGWAAPEGEAAPGREAVPGGYTEPAAAEWGEPERYRGPTTALAAERARQARMTVVGAVTERWAPEQAGPVYDNWRLAPPVGAAADLWALGVLLFRAVQGHAPYPEDSAAELVQMVCAEPPAFAEDCGPLRPVVESLLRQDPMERPEFEELRGWLRSLIRSAPEPEVGRRTVTGPPSLEPGGPADPHRLPIVRRRGELVRRRKERRRAEKRARAEAQRAAAAEEPHIQLSPSAARKPKAEKPRRAERPPKGPREPRIARGGGRRPVRLGRLLVGAVLLALTAAVLYATWFMPDAGEGDDAQRRGSVGNADRPAPDDDAGEDAGKGSGEDAGGSEGAGSDKGDKGNGRSQDGGSGALPGTAAPKGYKMSNDPAGFRVAVPKKWDRRSVGESGEVRYNGGAVEMVVANGRDTAEKFGRDLMEYQLNHEPELAGYRNSEFDNSASGLRDIDVGDKAMVEGTFTWPDSGGREVYARNRAMLHEGKYHVLLVKGPKSQRAEIDETFEAVADTYGTRTR
ncbi:hypothetical protein [Streptomyces xiaopingdaonensis]|uniref:hypothetical protein n=1 Tax=Streptomyces xiaopingdaonensis TaxID=1565415 RepID=UPI0002DD96AB|nr:hypothetical protein [Streptomyces xiaopingdaonensis]